MTTKSNKPLFFLNPTQLNFGNLPQNYFKQRCHLSKLSQTSKTFVLPAPLPFSVPKNTKSQNNDPLETISHRLERTIAIIVILQPYCNAAFLMQRARIILVKKSVVLSAQCEKVKVKRTPNGFMDIRQIVSDRFLFRTNDS